MFSDQVSHIHGHLLHGGVVESLNVPERALVILSHHVDGDTLSAKTSTTPNPKHSNRLEFLNSTSPNSFFSPKVAYTYGYYLPVDVIFPVCRQIIVDDQGHLLHINASSLVREKCI